MKPEQKPEIYSTPLSEQLLTSATRVLRGFVRLFITRMTFDVMVDMLRRIMVEEGCRMVAKENGGKVILSRVALLTGIRTQAIKELRRQPLQCDESDLTLEARILAIWANDPKYRNPETDQPMELIIHGGGCTFQRLVSSVAGRGVTTQTVLERLLENNNIEIVNEHWVRLLTPQWRFVRRVESDMLDAGSFHAENVLSTLVHNMTQPDHRWVERSVWSVSLPDEQVEHLREVLNQAMKSFYEETAMTIRKHEDKDRIDLNSTLVGMGLCYWERTNSQEGSMGKLGNKDQVLNLKVNKFINKGNGNNE